MPTLGAALDFAQLEAKSLRAHQLGVAPTVPAPVKGQIYFNTGDNTLYWYDGTAWVSSRGSVIPDATTSVKGIVQLAGDLAGTAVAPVVAAGAITDTKVAAANKDGAVGVASMRTLGTGATQAAAGNDSRFTDSRNPTGAAGGDLSGTYPNPQIAAATIVDADVAAANKDGSAAVPSLRTLGTGGTQAAAGNDARFTDARAPTAHHATHEPGGSDPMTVDAAAATGSLRTLGLTGSKAMPGTTTLDQIAAPAAAVSFNSKAITGVLDPVNPQDGATKNYVDNAAQGLDAKASVKAATTANIATLAGGAPNTLDGVTLVNGDRVLVKDQTTPAQNGIYTVTTVGTGVNGTWARAADTDTWNELVSAYTWIEQGTTQGDTGWVSTVDQGGTLGTTAVTWTQFSGAGQITAGAGLTKLGNSLDVGGTANRITVGADTVDIAATYVGQASITTLGTITTGTWTGTTIAVANGGTGQTTAKAGRETGLGASGYYNNGATHGAGTTITITAATHGLRASRGLIVQVQDNSTGAVILTDVSVAANGDVTVSFANSQTANTILVTIIG